MGKHHYCPKCGYGDGLVWVDDKIVECQNCEWRGGIDELKIKED